MTDSSYASSPEMPHRIPPPTRPLASSKAITVTAGAGFRLSLALNAVGTESALRHEMASNDIEIQVIAKKISDFSIMLKQVGRIVEDHRTIASDTAIDTVREIRDESERDFDEIKSMIEMVQKRDEQGHFRGIEVAQRVTWSFKKRKMQYLLGQLEYLKDSLAIMLQTLQLGKEIASAYEGKIRNPTQRTIEQERAEIQNMIVVQHWSMLELQKLYGLAEKEALLEVVESPELDSPPPSYDAGSRGNHLAITIGESSEVSAKKVADSPPRPDSDENSRALVTYQERPLALIRDSCDRVMEREEQALGAPVADIVDHLLDEWTKVGVPSYYQHQGQIGTHRPRHETRRTTKHQAQVESDESDTSEYDSDFERSKNIGGYFIEGPRSAVKKNVRFRASVEDAEDEDLHREGRHTKKHTLGRVDESSTESDDSSSRRHSLTPAPPYRRTSTSSNGSHNASQTGSERQRRPYSRNSYEQPGSRPGSSRGVPTGQPMPMPGGPILQPPQLQQQGRTTPMPVPPPNFHWQGPGSGYPPTPGLRPPSQSGPPTPQPPRLPSTGSYMGPSPSASPIAPQGGYFPAFMNGGGSRGVTPQQQQQPQPQPYPPTPLSTYTPQPPMQSPLVYPGQGARQQSYPHPAHQRPSHFHHHGSSGGSSHHRRRSSSRHRDSHRRDSTGGKGGKKEESSASRNVKRGILGGTAIAGMMEILQGLDGL